MQILLNYDYLLNFNIFYKLFFFLPIKNIFTRTIKPHAPPLVLTPVNSFEFQSCDYTPQAKCLSR